MCCKTVTCAPTNKDRCTYFRFRLFSGKNTACEIWYRSRLKAHLFQVAYIKALLLEELLQF